MTMKRPRGTADVTPGDIARWRYIEDIAREVCHLYGYGEIITPTMEDTELFRRTVGETTDIVEKEMYTFEDRSGRSLTLRPEGTAPTARMYLQENLYSVAQPVKLAYVGCPFFRYERPQAGRMREYHQFGVECFGSADAAVDAEVIALACDFLHRTGVDQLQLGVNSIGCPDCRNDYREALRDHFEPHLEQLCVDCQRRYEVNPLRLLDCKRDECGDKAAGAPSMLQYLCGECAAHFAELREHLERFGLPHEVDQTLVRGLDYYTRTVFEITHHTLGAHDVVCGGGRYDGLVEVLGGDPTPAVGFGLGIERLLLILEEEEIELPSVPGLDCFIIYIGEDAKGAGLQLLQELRSEGISADTDYLERSVRAQMRFADRYPSRFAVLLGADELEAGVVTLRDMSDGSQQSVPRNELTAVLRDAVR